MPDDRIVETRTIPSDPLQFRGVRNWLASVARQEGFDERESMELLVAVNEACSNIHRHAYAGREDGSIEFQVEVREAVISLRIRDYGSTFRPETCPRPDVGNPSEGGYGVYLIRELMDEVEYISKEAGTELRMLKYRQGGLPGVEGDGDVGDA